MRGAVAQAVASAAPAELRTAEAGTQASLFGQMPAPKVVPIPTLTPLRPAERHGRHSTGSRPGGYRPRQVPEAQQAFDLQEYRGEVQSRGEEQIQCAAPVASPGRRALAGAADGALVLAGACIVVLPTLLAFGDEIRMTQAGLGMLVATLLPVYVLYRLLWALANADTPGFRLAGLRLVDFDGRIPRREQRLKRQAAGAVSIVAVGLGMVWPLVHEENLAWHDLMTKTFPTPE